MKKIILLIWVTISLSGFAQNKYQYKIDLIQTQEHWLSVELLCPEILTDTISLQFPAIIPGHYERVDYGRFISKFTAWDKSGNPLKVIKTGTNSYHIKNARKLYKINYIVNSIYHHKKGSSIPPTSGSIFDAQKVFAFNTGAVCGYFESLKNIPIQVEIEKPDGFYGITSMPEIKNQLNKQVFKTNNYHHLIDCPMLFSLPDTASLKLGNTIIQIGVYAETGEKSAQLILNAARPYLQAVQKYIGKNLPIQKYSLLVYLKDLTQFKEEIYGSESLSLIQKIKMSKTHVGALEHGTSSFYFYADAGKPESYLYYMQRTCSHELLHIFTPLQLKSTIVDNFNYGTPVMSKHLWLYEGVTDYFSWHAKLKAGLIGLDEFLNEVMRVKMLIMNKFPENISFTDWSSKVIEKPWNEHYSQVYNKGTVMAMLLDFEIMRLTNGEKTLFDIINQLCNIYKNKPFEENEIFNEITKLAHPDLAVFFNKYYLNTDKPELKKELDIVGLNFEEKVTENIPASILYNAYGVEMAIERVRVYHIEKVQPGSIFKKNDKILYDVFGEYCRTPFRDKEGNWVKEGTIVNVPIIRDGKEMLLPIKVEYAPATQRYKISINETMNASQKKLFEKWVN